MSKSGASTKSRSDEPEETREEGTEGEEQLETRSRAEEARSDASRGSEDRAKEERDAAMRAIAWDYSALPPPPKTPENADYSYRYVRVELAKEPDMGNFGRALQRGFVPVTPDELPGFHAPHIKHGQFEGMIGIQGLVLCKIPKEFLKIKQEIVARGNSRLENAVKNDALRIQDRRMPFVDHENSSSVSKGIRLRAD